MTANEKALALVQFIKEEAPKCIPWAEAHKPFPVIQARWFREQLETYARVVDDALNEEEGNE